MNETYGRIAELMLEAKYTGKERRQHQETGFGVERRKREQAEEARKRGIKKRTSGPKPMPEPPDSGADRIGDNTHSTYNRMAELLEAKLKGLKGKVAAAGVGAAAMFGGIKGHEALTTPTLTPAQQAQADTGKMVKSGKASIRRGTKASKAVDRAVRRVTGEKKKHFAPGSSKYVPEPWWGPGEK